uniref:DNA helicase n=1 Tax=Romanomermis culicivorax TaxID=13658 RepID=A0A915K9U2_ROMCU
MPVNRDEASFSEFLEVGNDENFMAETNVKPILSEMGVYSRDDLIDFCFQKAKLENLLEYLDSFRDSAILAPTNLTVDLLNLQILNAMPGEG